MSEQYIDWAVANSSAMGQNAIAKILMPQKIAQSFYMTWFASKKLLDILSSLWD